MGSPYPLHYTVRWPYYYLWPSKNNHTKMDIKPSAHSFIKSINEKPMKLFFCGDIMLTQKDRYPILHSEVKSLLNQADLFIGNCEAPIGSHSLNLNASYHLIYHMPQLFLKNIMSQLTLNPDQWVLSVANNHAGDKGAHAYLESVSMLKSMGIHVVGDINQSGLPLNIVERHQARIGIASWTNWMNREVFNNINGVGRTEQIRRVDWNSIKEHYKLDCLVGLPHWEYEFQHFPKHETRELASELINHNGFNLIIGAHPHTLQPMEWFKNGLCQYSLGNFCGLGLAWPVRLIPILEVHVGTSNEHKGKILEYRLHKFAQVNSISGIDILPFSEIDPPLKQKLEKRFNLLFT